MALACVSGGRECGGCGRCFRDGPEYACPVCGDALYATATVYLHDNEIIGCEHCISTKQAYEAMED